MSMWGVVVVVGALSLAIRALPLVRSDTGWLGPRGEQALHHAGIGAMAALLVGALLPGPAGSGRPQLGLLVAVAVGGVLAWRGRSMIVVVAAGVVVSFGVTMAAALR
jgi:branched-subunit amino acid transport protein